MKDQQPNHTRIYHAVISGIILAAIFAFVGAYNTFTLIQASVTKMTVIQEFQAQTLNDVKVILAEFRKDKKHIVYRMDGLETRVDNIEEKVAKQ